MHHCSLACCSSSGVRKNNLQSPQQSLPHQSKVFPNVSIWWKHLGHTSRDSHGQTSAMQPREVNSLESTHSLETCPREVSKYQTLRSRRLWHFLKPNLGPQPHHINPQHTLPSGSFSLTTQHSQSVLRHLSAALGKLPEATPSVAQKCPQHPDAPETESPCCTSHRAGTSPPIQALTG